MSQDCLFTPLRLGHYQLSNRIVMPPMTRSRASQPGDVANALMADYYAQRASAGLIIAEGTQISAARAMPGPRASTARSKSPAGGW